MSRANSGGTSEAVESDTVHAGMTVIAQDEVADRATERGRPGEGLGVGDVAAADTAAGGVWR